VEQTVRSPRRSQFNSQGESKKAYDPSFGGYLRSLHSSSGFGVRLAAAIVFSLALILEKGFITFLVVVVGVLLVMLLVVYPLYRRRGPGPF
jgi:hypothetical protein